MEQPRAGPSRISSELLSSHLQQLLSSEIIDPQTSLLNGQVELSQSNPTPIKMRPLTDREAIQLCKQSLKKYKNAILEERKQMIPEMQYLCTCLENHPVAIRQAIGYLNETMKTLTIVDFIEKYEKNIKVFHKKNEKFGDDYSHTVATVFDLSMDLIAKTDSALEMLYFSSFSKAEATPIEFFEFLYGETRTRRAVAALERLNLASSVQRVTVTNLASIDDDDSIERQIALQQLAGRLASLDDDDSSEKSKALQFLARRLQHDSDDEGTRCVSVKQEVQKVVREHVMDNNELIEVVFQAAFIVEDGAGFPILETLMQNNQEVDIPGCDLHTVFLNQWEFVQTDQVAASAVMMTAFCGLNEVFPWEEIFGSEKWTAAQSVLEQTCFRNLSLDDDDYVHGFHTNVNFLILQLTEMDKDKCSVLSNSISLALSLLEEESIWLEYNLSTYRRKKYIQRLQQKQQEVQVNFFLFLANNTKKTFKKS